MPAIRQKTWKFMLMRAKRKELGLSMDNLRFLVVEDLKKAHEKAPGRSTFFMWERAGGMYPRSGAVREALARALGVAVEDLWR